MLDEVLDVIQTTFNLGLKEYSSSSKRKDLHNDRIHAFMNFIGTKARLILIQVKKVDVNRFIHILEQTISGFASSS